MIRVLPAVALFLLPLAASAQVAPAVPTPEATMQSGPTPDQVYAIMRAVEPLARADETRYRAAMIAAIEPEQREPIGDAFAAYVMAAAPDRGAFAARLDAMLTPNECERIVAATRAHFADLQATSAKMEAEMAREFPASSQNQPNAEEQVSLARSALGTPPPPSAGDTLARWLAAPPPDAIGARYFAPDHQWTPLQTHGPRDAAIRVKLRTAMLAAILPAHRAAVARAFAVYAFSADGSYDALARNIDAVLQPEERSAINDAYIAFAADQRAGEAAMDAQRQAFFEQFPQANRPAMPFEQRIGPNDTGSPGMLLARALLTSTLTTSLRHVPNGGTAPGP